MSKGLWLTSLEEHRRVYTSEDAGHFSVLLACCYGIDMNRGGWAIITEVETEGALKRGVFNPAFPVVRTSTLSTTSVIYELEHVIKFIVRNIKRKLNTYDDHTILKEIVKSGRSRAITEVMIINLRMYSLYRS